MPHGYLKNASGESRRRARGGGSHRLAKSKNNQLAKGGRSKHKGDLAEEKIHLAKSLEILEDGYDCHDFVEVGRRNRTSSSTTMIRAKPAPPTTRAAVTETLLRDCPICFESKPVVPLMKVCSWHEQACWECLRQVYVTQAQKAARNFPLTCFHPQCRRPLRETQLLKHGLIKTQDELERHFRLTELAKGEKVGYSAVHCPHCDHPRAYKPSHNDNSNGTKVRNHIFTCRKCQKNFMVSPYAEIIRALEHSDGDGSTFLTFAQCPRCGMLLTRDSHAYGDDAACVCGAQFGWTTAQRESGFRFPFGRPSALDPYDVLYLHW